MPILDGARHVSKWRCHRQFTFRVEHGAPPTQTIAFYQGQGVKDQSIDRALSNSSLTTDKANDTGNEARIGKRHMVVDWTGFIGGETSTRFFSADLGGVLQLRITLAGNEVIVPAGDNPALRRLWITSLQPSQCG